jgi:hypothetical protein
MLGVANLKPQGFRVKRVQLLLIEANESGNFLHDFFHEVQN